MGAAQRAGLSRVTLAGDQRRVDLVLPSNEPIGTLLPEILQLLGDTVAEQPVPRQLVTADGSILAQDSTLATAAVPHGAVLRLVRAYDAPSAPVVHDVTDEAAEDLDMHAWRWRPAARRAVAGLAAVVFTAAAGTLARGAFEAPAVVLLVAAMAVAVAGGFSARLGNGNRGLAGTLVLTAGVLGALAAWTAAEADNWSAAACLLALATAATATLLLLGLFSPLGRGGLIGGGAVAATTVVWEVTALLQDDPSRVGAVLAVASVLGLGLLPRLALMAAGLTGLDNRRSAGASVSRHQVDTALAATHRGLALSTVITAASAVAAGWLAVSTTSVWTVSLTAVLAVVLVSRSRAYPLVAEVVALLIAAAVLLLRLVVLWAHSSDAPPYGPLAVLAVAAVLPLGVLAVQPPEHVRVRLRRVADLVESAGVIALFPLTVGAFGVYGRLLHAF